VRCHAGESPADLLVAMIKNFTDHSANERTFLAWVRTAIAAARFLRTAKNIDSTEQYGTTGSRIDLTLAGLLILLGGALFLYLSHAFVSKI
jgi:uncharacterized membrane protein YidH (DUF202 family)